MEAYEKKHLEDYFKSFPNMGHVPDAEIEQSMKFFNSCIYFDGELFSSQNKVSDKLGLVYSGMLIDVSLTNNKKS